MPVDGWMPVIAAPVIAVVALAARAVSVSGALAGLCVALALVFGMGWAGLGILATLVGVGTLVSPAGDRRRDAVQALSNGSIAGLGALASGMGWEWGGAAAVGALAASLSDTAAGELGRRFGGTPRLLLLGPRIEAGTDGGMSWVGTGAGVAFAWPVPVIAWALGGLPSFGAVSTVAAAGVFGNLLDSVFGATIQPRLGRRGNDAVNLLATAAAAAIAAVVA